MKCPDDETLEEYALGGLSQTEREAIERCIVEGRCDCNTRLSEINSALALLARALPPIAPPTDLKSELLVKIHAEENRLRLSSHQSIRSVDTNRESQFPWLHVAVCILGLGLGYYMTSLFTRLSAVANKGQQESANLQSEIPKGLSLVADSRVNTAQQSTSTGNKGFVILYDDVSEQVHAMATGFRIENPTCELICRLSTLDTAQTTTAPFRLDPSGVMMSVFDVPKSFWQQAAQDGFLHVQIFEKCNDSEPSESNVVRIEENVPIQL